MAATSNLISSYFLHKIAFLSNTRTTCIQARRQFLQLMRLSKITQSRQNSYSTSNEGTEQSKDPLDELSKAEKQKEDQHEHDIKQKILKASLPFVHELGWTKKSLEAGAQAEGLPPIAHGMFPRGGSEIIHYFYRKSNEDLVEILKSEVEKAKQENLQKPKTRPFIHHALESRLRMILPYKDIWPQAMALQVLPQNAKDSWCNLAQLVDNVWYYAGDRSVDFNWYTKRTVLAGVYKSTEIYMIQDRSLDQEDTWEFLDRRLNDIDSFGAAKESCESGCKEFNNLATGMLIMGRNILGINSRDR